jgi:glycyl-tRNA synthetase beta subunit
MNSHLKSFYPDDALNESSSGGGGSINKSVTGDSLNNNSLTNSFSNSPQAAVDSAEYDRKINLLTKKLRSYEKRRHKLIYESKQEQDAAAANANATSASASSTTQQSNHQTSQSSDAPLNPIDNKVDKFYDVTINHSDLGIKTTQKGQNQNEIKILNFNQISRKYNIDY